jgi:hypothetical protein
MFCLKPELAVADLNKDCLANVVWYFKPRVTLGAFGFSRIRRMTSKRHIDITFCLP